MNCESRVVQDRLSTHKPQLTTHNSQSSSDASMCTSMTSERPRVCGGLSPPVKPDASAGSDTAPDRLLAARLFRQEAERQGFTRVGIARAGEPSRFDLFRSWVAGGMHAGMAYLERTLETRASPDRVLPGARSIVCLAAPHSGNPLIASDGARIARYASGADYHGTLRERTLRVARAVASRLRLPFRYRVCVDSTPLAERSFAAAAGLGWIGKNGCLIDAECGSFLLLAEILTDLDLPADEPVAERCGTCVRCLEACPTQAFSAPGLLDASRCLAYWTIEHRGAIPDAVKEKLGPHVFGCDLCQEICPWNAPLLPAATERPPARREWLEMGPGQWRRRYGSTALNRAGRRGIQRNAAASGGSVRDPTLRPALSGASRSTNAGLSDAVAWASRRLPWADR